MVVRATRSREGLSFEKALSFPFVHGAEGESIRRRLEDEGIGQGVVTAVFPGCNAYGT